MNFSSLLSQVTREEILAARDRIGEIGFQDPVILRWEYRRVSARYPAFSEILNLVPDPDALFMNPGKVAGYQFASHLLAALAERRPQDALESALRRLTVHEVAGAMHQIFAGESGTLTDYVVASGKKYPGFVSGMCAVFSNLSDRGLEQEGIGHIVITGVILKIAESAAEGIGQYRLPEGK